MKDCRENFSEQIDIAQWQWLKPHNERGALVLVDRMLMLAEAGQRVHDDDIKTVQSWLANRLLAKPTVGQLAEWDKEPEKLFRMLIISPYVLIQPTDTPDNEN